MDLEYKVLKKEKNTHRIQKKENLMEIYLWFCNLKEFSSETLEETRHKVSRLSFSI